MNETLLKLIGFQYDKLKPEGKNPGEEQSAAPNQAESLYIMPTIIKDVGKIAI